jgi:hypothetical protein
MRCKLPQFPVCGAVLALLSEGAVAQQLSLKDELVGTWRLVSIDLVRPDGSKAEVFGSDPNGIVIYTRDGQYALINSRSDLPKFASNNRNQGTPDENKAVVQGSIAYFGTYSVNELTKTISLRINGSTYPNMIGAPDEQRVITSLTAEELRFTNPASSTGAKLEVVWRRAK